MALTSLTRPEHTNALRGQAVALLAVQSLLAGNAFFPRMTLDRECFCWSSGGFGIFHPL